MLFCMNRYFVLIFNYTLYIINYTLHIVGLHFELVGTAVLVVFDHGVETGAAGAAGDRNGVHIQFHRDDTALVALAHLLGDVEDEGGVHAVVELHRQVHIVAVGVIDLRLGRDLVGLQAADAEGHQTSADDIHALVNAVVHGDGIVAGAAGVDVRGAGEAGEVGLTMSEGDASVVVVQHHLREIDVGDGQQQHVEFLNVDVALGIVFEAFEVAVDLDALVVGGEQGFGAVEGVGVARCLVAGHVHGLVRGGGDTVQRRLLVEDQTLYAVDRRDLVPAEDVPEAPVVAALEVGALDGGGQHALVGLQRLVAGVVAAEVEDGRQDISYFAEDIHVRLVPAVVPLGPPVVLDIEVHLVVPVNLQVEVHDRQVDDHIFALVEVQLGLALARV